MKLNNKTALIVGAANPVNRETAALFIKEGARVAFFDPYTDFDGGFVWELQEQGGTVLYQHVDITDFEAVKAMVERTVEIFSGVDVFVAGAFSRLAPVPTMEVEDAQWHQETQVCLTGQFLCCKYLIPVMEKQGGSIVFVSSGLAMRAEPDCLISSSVAFGILGFMRCIASDYSQLGIRANAICPGVCAEELPQPQEEEAYAKLNLMKRHAAAGEIAKGILYLACDDSSFVTGTTLSVDGGLHIF